MPSVGLLRAENTQPGGGLSALLSRMGTHCSRMAGGSLSAKKAAAFLFKMDHCAEGKSNHQGMELQCVCHHQQPSHEKGRRFQPLVHAAASVDALC